MIGPDGFAISNSLIYEVSVAVLLVGLPTKRQLILLSRVTYWAPVEML
jgi:hypothetical protein